tara:strand:+ start:14708 stop:15439 length:732 start_codon:yes stop_codon:yes gene_type:complete
MKIGACVANYVGNELAKFIVSNGCELDYVVTCENDSYEEEIYNTFTEAGVPCHRKTKPDEFILDGTDKLLLLWWPHILKEDVINCVSDGVINLHPSYLPYNRGTHPYYWSLVDDTPAGVSIHLVTPRIDDGDILFQEKIETPITMTGQELYDVSIHAIIDLFKRNYKNILTSNYIPTPQDTSINTFHWAKDIEDHSEIKLDMHYKASDLINIMRARTFSGKSSSYFMLDGKKYYVNLGIYDER